MMAIGRPGQAPTCFGFGAGIDVGIGSTPDARGAAAWPSSP
jgi:hypothetical protein